MSENERPRLDTLMELLADEVAMRLAQRQMDEPHQSSQGAESPLATTGDDPQAEGREWPMHAVPAYAHLPEVEATGAGEEPVDSAAPVAVKAGVSSSAPLLVHLALGILAIVALINIPLNAEGTALARAIPSSASLVIRDGLVVKETSSPEFWVYREGAFRWIPSLDAFQQYGYRWDDVRVVEDGFLSRYQKGAPLYPLLKCRSSDHVYRLEEGHKRWIVDLATFHAEGHKWEEVRYVDCAYLRALPDGETIPPGSGTPPPPLP